MSPEKDQELFEKFPKLYRNYVLPMNETCMCWGFECPDEWYYVLYELSERIETYLQENNLSLEVDQVKEKFGGLRYYYSGFNGNDEQMLVIESFITDAEIKVKMIDKNNNINRIY